MTTTSPSTTLATPTGTGYVDVNGVHLYHETYGPDDGVPLVLVHGGMLSIDLSWAPLIPRLPDRYRLVAVEVQGHGRTANIDREITPAALASDVVGLLDHLGIERAHVLGHSMGGRVAMGVGVSHPGRGRAGSCGPPSRAGAKRLTDPVQGPTRRHPRGPEGPVEVRDVADHADAA